MTERERQTDFLKRLLVLAEPKAERELHARINQAQHDEKCIRFAFILVALVGGFAVCGLGYCAVLHPEFFDSSAPTLVKICCAVALGSMICMIVFCGCWLWYRSNSNRLYEEGRQVVMQAINARLKTEPGAAFVETVEFSHHEPTSAVG